MAQASVRFNNNPQNYNAYENLPGLNANISNSAARGTYETTSQAYVAPQPRITFNHAGSSNIITSAQVARPDNTYIAPYQAQVGANNSANPQTFAVQRTEVIAERPADRTSTVQKSEPFSGTSANYSAPVSNKPADSKCPKWLWALLGVLALALIVLGILWATGVLGGRNNSNTNSSTQVANNTPATSTSTTSSTTTSPTASLTTGASTTSTNAAPSGTTTVSSSTTTANSGVAPMGIPAQQVKTTPTTTASSSTAQPASTPTAQPTGTTQPAAAPTTTAASSSTTGQPATTSTSTTTTTTTTKTA